MYKGYKNYRGRVASIPDPGHCEVSGNEESLQVCGIIYPLLGDFLRKIESWLQKTESWDSKISVGSHDYEKTGVSQVDVSIYPHCSIIIITIWDP